MLLKFVCPFENSQRYDVDNFTRLTTVEEIRENVSPFFKFSVDDIRLLCRGKELVDGCTLYEYGIKDGDMIYVSKKKLKMDINCNESAASTPSVSPKSVVSSSEPTEIETESRFFKVGEKVDVSCSESGSWFEATVEKIVQKSTEDEKIREENDDSLAYHCSYDFCGDTKEVVDLSRLAPRAWVKINFADVNVGQKVLVNYNVDAPGELGDWYRASIVSKEGKHKREFLLVTLFLGNGRADMENCKIVKVDEIYAYEETALLTERLETILPEDYRKRTTRQCTRCHDNPRKKCHYCHCVVCGSADDEANTMLCEECDEAYHFYCLNPPLSAIPSDDWYCPNCKVDDSEVVKAGEKIKTTKRMSKMPGIVNKQTRQWDNGNSCKGVTKSCTIVGKNHSGPIPGVEVGTTWLYRWQVLEAGVHRSLVGGIHGREKDGAYSIVVSGGYEDDEDKGDEIFYTGSGGRDLRGNKRTAGQSKEQVFARMNLALARSCCAPLNKKGGDAHDKWTKGKPVRVCRSYKAGLKGHSKFAPERGCRYDGIYKVVRYWPQIGQGGHEVYRFLLRRDDNVPAPWTKAGNKRIRELGLENVIEPPEENNKTNKRKGDVETDESNDVEPTKRAKYQLNDTVMEFIRRDNVNKKVWDECLPKCENGQKAFVDAMEEAFRCIICASLLYNPVTLTCGHSICKNCLKRSFDENFYNCPTCRLELGKNYVMTVNESLNNALKAIFPGYNNE